MGVLGGRRAEPRRVAFCTAFHRRAVFSRDVSVVACSRRYPCTYVALDFRVCIGEEAREVSKIDHN
jgi:hypothetical protein